MVALAAERIGVAGLGRGIAAIGLATGAARKDDGDAAQCDHQPSSDHNVTTQDAPDDRQRAAPDEGRPRTTGHDEKDSAHAEACS